MNYKLVVLGADGVGKSALVMRLITSQFLADTDSNVQDSYRTEVVVDGEVSGLDILDTAGTEDFSSAREEYLRMGDGFLIVYSITSASSFQEVPNFHDLILRVKDLERAPAILAATQRDAEHERQVTTDQGRALANEWKLPFMETSAKVGLDVENVFVELVREIRRMA